MLEKLKEKLKIWGEAMDGLDDPQGEYLLSLDNRIVRLEQQLEQVRQSLKIRPADGQDLLIETDEN